MWGPPLEWGSEGGGGLNLRSCSRRSVEGATAGRLAKTRAFFLSTLCTTCSSFEHICGIAVLSSSFLICGPVSPSRSLLSNTDLSSQSVTVKAGYLAGIKDRADPFCLIAALMRHMRCRCALVQKDSSGTQTSFFDLTLVEC